MEYLLWNVVPDCVVAHVRNLGARRVEMRLMSFRRRLHRGAVLDSMPSLKVGTF